MQMTCPKCQGQMRQYERSGITVDQCGECRGIFLDRGELERLIDAENAWHGAPPQPAAAQQPHPQQQQPGRPYRDYDSDEYPVYGGHPGKRKKRRGFLEDLFD
jgi:Zn-finger nucleic acid-binding protein